MKEYKRIIVILISIIIVLIIDIYSFPKSVVKFIPIENHVPVDPQ